jgi:hypothetical protein
MGKKFKSTMRKYRNVGGKKFMLGPKDFQKGINTIEEKLNHSCPLYYRMESMFGGRQNVLPTHVFYLTLVVVIILLLFLIVLMS